MSSSPSSSEVKNSTATDIDNNIQDEVKSSPAPTPTRKRMSRAEKARLESEELLKSLGVSIDSGRQTRSSRRGGRVESPKPEPPPTPKRKAATNATPGRGRGKRAKVEENDQTDGTNHVEEKSQSDEIQSTPAAASEKVDESPAEAPAASQKIAEPVQQMEVDDPIESTQEPAPATAAEEPAPPSPPTVEIIEPPSPTLPPSSQPPEPSQPIVEEPLSSSPSPDEATPAVIVESQPEIVASEPAVVAAAAADTTTAAIVIDTESQETIDASCEAASQSRDGEPIELVSSPSSDVDAKSQQQQQQTQEVNSQTICASQSDAIVDLDTSSNEGDDVKEVTDSSSDIVCSQRPPQQLQQTQDLDTLDLELINSDSSSHSENEVQIADIPPPPSAPNAQDAPSQPTSTVQSDVVEIDIDANDSLANVAVADTNADQRNNSNADAVAAVENSVVESTNQQEPIEIPENICTITVNTPVDETITTTSEQLLPQSNITTA